MTALTKSEKSLQEVSDTLKQLTEEQRKTGLDKKALGKLSDTLRSAGSALDPRMAMTIFLAKSPILATFGGMLSSFVSYEKDRFKKEQEITKTKKEQVELEKQVVKEEDTKPKPVQVDDMKVSPAKGIIMPDDDDTDDIVPLLKKIEKHTKISAKLQLASVALDEKSRAKKQLVAQKAGAKRKQARDAKGRFVKEKTGFAKLIASITSSLLLMKKGLFTAVAGIFSIKALKGLLVNAFKLGVTKLAPLLWGAFKFALKGGGLLLAFYGLFEGIKTTIKTYAETGDLKDALIAGLKSFANTIIETITLGSADLEVVTEKIKSGISVIGDFISSMVDWLSGSFENFQDMLSKATNGLLGKEKPLSEREELERVTGEISDLSKRSSLTRVLSLVDEEARIEELRTRRNVLIGQLDENKGISNISTSLLRSTEETRVLKETVKTGTDNGKAGVVANTVINTTQNNSSNIGINPQTRNSDNTINRASTKNNILGLF